MAQNSKFPFFLNLNIWDRAKHYTVTQKPPSLESSFCFFLRSINPSYSFLKKKKKIVTHFVIQELYTISVGAMEKTQKNPESKK